MRTTKTRLLSLILAVMMLVSMLPTMALAEDIVLEDSETESSQPTARTDTVILPDNLPANTVAWNDKDGDGLYAAGEDYTALETALTEVGANQTIVLVKNYNYLKYSTGSVTIPATSQNVTVNLNGKTLLATGYAFATASAESSATVTIKNGTLTCETAGRTLFSIGGGSTVTLENMTITNNGATGTDGGTAISFASKSEYAATLNLVNCTVKSTNSYAILMPKAVHVLNITNSHITTNGESIPAIASSAAATVNFLDAASTLNYMTSGYAYSTGKGLTVNSYTGYKLVEAIDATTGGYTMSMVAIEAEVEPEAAFGGKDYDTLAEALAAAFEAKGGTVTLKKDVIINNGYYHNTTAATYAIEIKGEDCLEEPLTLDLDDHTITTTGTLLRYQECKQDIVIRNGKVNATGAQGAGNLIAIANAGALKLENLTITGHEQYIVRIYEEQANDVTLDHVTVKQAVENEKHRPIVVGADTTTANINVTNGSEIYSSVEAVDIQSGTTSKVYLDDTSFLYHKEKAPATGETANLVASVEGYVISTTAEADANDYYTTTAKQGYTVTWDAGSGQTTTAVYAAGDIIVPPADPTKDGYDFDGWAGYTENMTMPAENVTFTATWTEKEYVNSSVTIAACTNGSATADKATANNNETVTVTATPGTAAYYTGSVTAVDASGNNVPCTVDASNENVYTFIMPESNVTVTVNFVLKEAKIDETYYKTLQDAVSAAVKSSSGASQNVEVVMQRDVTLASRISITKGNVTLDLGGYTLTSPVAAIRAGATSDKSLNPVVTITNGTIIGATTTYAHVVEAYSNSTLTMDGVAVYNTNCANPQNGRAALTISHTADATLTNCTMESAYGPAICVRGTDAENHGTLTISGGTITTTAANVCAIDIGVSGETEAELIGTVVFTGAVTINHTMEDYPYGVIVGSQTKTAAECTTHVTMPGCIATTTSTTENEVTTYTTIIEELRFGQTSQIRLIEPWGLKVNARVYTDSQQTTFDCDALYDYGAYFIRASELDVENPTQDTVTVEDIINDSDATLLDKTKLTITVDDSNRERLTAIYDKGLYTYEFNDSVFVMFYVIPTEGAEPTYAGIRERNLSDLVNSFKGNSTYSEKERAVYSYMSELETNILSYRADFENPGVSPAQKAPTLAENPMNMGEVITGTYKVGHTHNVRLIEPWGLKVNGRVYTAETPSGGNIDYTTLEDYGVIIRFGDGEGLVDKCTAATLLSYDDAYVFSAANGDATIENGKITAIFTKDIYTYLLNTNMYVMFYVKDADGYHVGDVRQRNVYNIVDANKDSTSTTYSDKEKAVYATMVNLYDSVTAYRADFS